MKKIELRAIKFGSFFKFIMLISLSSGVAFGILLFVIGIFGGDVNANLGPLQLTGVAGGALSLITGPIVVSFFGLFISVFSYIPFKLLLKIIKKISLYGDFYYFSVQEVQISEIEYDSNNLEEEAESKCNDNESDEQ